MRRSSWCLGLVLVVISAIQARAQSVDELLGRTVTAIRFEVEGRPDSSPALLSLVDVKAGKPLTQQDIRTSLERLDTTGRYEDVAPFAELSADGTALIVIFHLTPRHTINRLEVAGESGMANSALRDRLLEYYAGVPAVQPPAEVARVATQLMSEEGYLTAQATPTVVVQHDPEGATLTIQAVAGPRTHIAEATVEVTDPMGPYTPPDVLRRIGVGVGEPYRRRQVETAVSALEDDLRTRGYYEAEVTFRSTTEADGGSRLRFVVSTGARVEVRVEPRAAAPSDVDDLIPVKRERSVDTDLLEDGKAAIERALRRDGYAEAKVAFSRALSEDSRRLVVTFTIVRGPRYLVDRAEIPPNLAIPPATFAELLSIRSGDVFDQEKIEEALKRVVDAYLRLGYYAVEANPDRERVTGKGTTAEAWIVLHPNITEGPRGVVSAIDFTFSGDHAVPESELRSVMTSGVGRPYVALFAARDRAALLASYLDRGFVNAAVGLAPRFSEDGASVHLQVTVNEGPQVRIGDIKIIGNEHVSERAIADELGLQIGQPLSDRALRDARQRLYEMGVFRRVNVIPAERLAGETTVAVIVSVQEGPLTPGGVGGGVEVRRLSTNVNGLFQDHVEFSPRGSFDITRQNLGGRNRSLSLFSRVSLRTAETTSEVNDFGFTEYRSTLTYRERRAFRSNSDLLVAFSSEQARRTTFNFSRRAVNAELLHRLSNRVGVTGRYVLDFTRLFDERIPEGERPTIDRAFPQLRLSILSTGAAWDRRDDPLAPTRGTFVTGDVDVAARAIQSEVGFVKAFFQASGFRAIDTSRKTVLAARVELGLARGFQRTVPVVDDNGVPIVGPDGQPVTVETTDLPISQRFFAGGSTTVRGFQLDRLGIPDETLNSQGLPLGGNGVIVLNAEIRRVVATLFGKEFGVVGFLDGGNVFARAGDLDIARIRGSIGFGARWDSPLGLLRLDFGFKTRRDVVGGRLESPWEYHLSILEAF